MINLALRSEYSFKQTFGRIGDIHKFSNGHDFIGVADINNTYSHIYLEKIAKENGMTPIYGVRLMVVPDRRLKVRGSYGPIYTFIAKNDAGLVELYNLVKAAWANFYFKPMLPMSEMLDCSEDVFVITNNPISLERLDYIALQNNTPNCVIDFDIPKVFLNNNFYSYAWDKQTYELLCGARKHGDSYRFMFENQTYPMHIMTHPEFKRHFRNLDQSIIESAESNTTVIAEQCDASIPMAPMVKYHKKEDLGKLCRMGAIKLKIKLKGEYGDRLKRELSIIDEKDFADYFLIVAEVVEKAKKKMLVGPARGSSAGSLVCYLLGITTVDPIEHGLVFERFIDLNREDMPDIDIDFHKEKRKLAVNDLFKTYGEDNVYYISNINTLAAKSALGEFGMALSLPKYKIEQVKDSIVDRSGGDARKAIAVADTLEQTDVGKALVDEYPKMNLVKAAEGHATHAGKHAAGVIVCNMDLTNFCGVNPREHSIMLDKKGAELKNLLKIDFLGLRTLSILEEAAELAGLKRDFYYKLPTDDPEVYKIFEDNRFNGIFQFEGQAMQMLAKQMEISTFTDIVAITALARPGPLHSGAANTYVKRRNGEEEIEYVSDHPIYVEKTCETMGVIVYQEQLMQICRECANMSWTDVSAIRKAASKSLGKEFFDRYRDKFITGAVDNDFDQSEAEKIWEDMLTFGSWGMNKSHSVSYGYISYWTAYMKAKYPIEFTVANLNNAKSESSALKILRDVVDNDGLTYVPVDPDESGIKWSIKDGVMIGGLVNIKGVADKKAAEIVKIRNTTRKFTPSIMEKLMNPETPYDILYPTQHYWGDLFKNPQKYGLVKPPVIIDEIGTEEDGMFTIIGKVIGKDLRDLNEYNEVVKRGGKILENNNLFLRIIVEDDTNQILCKINRYDFERLQGQRHSEDLVVDKSWVIIKGKISKGWRILNIEAMFDLDDLEIERD